MNTEAPTPEPTDFFQYYTKYDLAPSKSAEWITAHAVEMQTHVVADFGWMSLGPVSGVSSFHLAKIFDFIDRIRALCEILENHALTKAAVVEANEEAV